MITIDQVPFVRLTAKKALAEGKIDEDQYKHILSLLDKVESERIRFDENILSETRNNMMRRNLSFA